MPIVQMPDGANVQFPDDMPREQIRSLISSKFPELGGAPAQPRPQAAQPIMQQQPDQTKIGGLMDFGNNIAQNAIGGVNALGDLAFGDFETPLNPQKTPATQNLADKLFPEGSEGSLMDLARNFTKPDLKDYSASLLEKFAANPAGKAVAALGGLVPGLNVAGSAYQTFARPALLKTGIAPENLDAGLLVGGALLGGRHLMKDKPVLPERAVEKTAAIMKRGDITPEQVANTMQEAQKQGINLTLPEASVKMGKSPTGAVYGVDNKLTGFQRVIERSGGEGAEILGQAKAGRAGQIADVMTKQGRGIVDAGDAAAKPLYEAVRGVKLDKGSVKTLVDDPIIKQAIGEISRDSKLKHLVKDLPRNSVGFFDEVKKYLDAEKQSSTLNNRVKSLYTDATRKITGTLDEAAPDYAQARAAARPAIVARESILDPLASSDSIGTIKNRIFASPEKRAELQRGIGDANYKNLSDLVNIIERTQKTAAGGSDTFKNFKGEQELANNYGKAAGMARGGVFGTLAAAADFISTKLDEGNYRDLAKLYSTQDINALRKELGAAYAKAPSGKIQAVTNFLQNRLPQAVLKAAPSNIAIQEQGKDRTIQTPPVTLPGATAPSSMDITPLEAMPPALPESPQSSIEGTINSAAQVTGVDPNLLHAIAYTESSLNPQAQSKTSSAAGLFQITKPTFRTLAKKYGEQYGITMRDVMNPEANALMAAHLTAENADTLGKALGREVTAGESYIAHFMGARGAAMLLKADPNKPAAKLFPVAAKANRSIFFDGRRPRTNGELAYLLAQKVESKQPTQGEI